MFRNRTCAQHSALFGVAVIFFLSFILESSGLELSIVESGSGPDTEVTLRVDRFDLGLNRLDQLVSPSGDVFTSASLIDEGKFTRLLKPFDSLSDAFNYVEGTWQGMYTRVFGPPASGTFTFSIADIPLETINQTPPTLVSPSTDAVIKNGSQYVLGWDYLTTGDTPDRSIITKIPQFDPIEVRGRIGFRTPGPGISNESNSFTGTGDRKFNTTVKDIPNADTNRFFVTMEAAEAALPLDVELTLGSHISFDEKLTLGDTTGLGSPSIPPVTFFYSREIDPFIITLSTVPEPSSLCLALLGFCPVRRRRR